MMNHPWEYHLDTPLHSSYMILQTCTFNRKIVSVGIVFSNYYLCTPLHKLAFYSLNYLLSLFPHNLTVRLYTVTIYLMYPLLVKEFTS